MSRNCLPTYSKDSFTLADRLLSLHFLRCSLSQMTICVLATSALEVRPEDVGMRFKSFFDRNRVLPLRELCQEVNGEWRCHLCIGKNFLDFMFLWGQKRAKLWDKGLLYIVFC